MFEATELRKPILVIEPSDKTRKTLCDFLSADYDCEEASCIGSGFEKIGKKGFEIVISNFDLDDSNALELLSLIKFSSPNTAVIFIGKNNSTQDVIKAFRTGAFDYLEKPFDFETLKGSVERAFDDCQTRQLRDNYEEHVRNLAAEKESELQKEIERIESSYRTTLKAVIQALETRDFENHGHSERVVTFSLRLAYEVGLEREKMRDLEFGALLHDIGKIALPDAILRKPAKLSEWEWERMKMHPTQGHKILRNIPFLEGAARVVAQHHERWDGKGYPKGLRGEEIDITARIFSVADAFDAMISERAYRDGRSFEEALTELEKYAGTQFDPMIVEAFRNVPIEDWEALQIRSQKNSNEVFSSEEIVEKLVTSQKLTEMVH